MRNEEKLIDHGIGGEARARARAEALIHVIFRLRGD